jgi:hypothetical protein
VFRSAPIATLLLVGLSTVPGLSDQGRATPTSTPLVPAVRSLDVEAYEATIAITPAGNLFYVAGRPGYTTPPLYVTGVPGEMWVHASHDGGKTWADVTPEDPTGEIIDPYITVDPITGRVFRAAYQAASVGGNGCVDLIWSDDEGRAWQHNPEACGIPRGPHDHESLATGIPRSGTPPAPYPNLLYLCVNRAEGSSCTVSRDGGLSFGTFVNVFPSAGPGGEYCGGLHSPVVTDAEGRVFLPRTYCGTPSIAVSEDEGATWTRYVIDTEHPPLSPTLTSVGGVDVPYIDLQDVMVEVDEEGNLHAAWVASDGMLWVASSRDKGRTWGEAWHVDVAGITAVAPGQFSVAAGGAGKLALAFAATDHPGGYAENPNPEDWEGAQWHLYLAVTEDAFAGHPVIDVAQVHDREDPIGVDDCGLTRCTPCEEDGTCGGWFDYMDVDLDAEGRPWAAFVDTCHEECRASGELDRPVAAVATLACGPALTSTGGTLPPLGWGPGGPSCPGGGEGELTACPGQAGAIAGNHLIGTPGDDVLKGTDGADVVCGMKGRDTLKGGPGRDHLYGGRGKRTRDRLLGGAGRDRLFGRGGPDILRGGPGRDLLHGDRGTRDVCIAGPGDRVKGCERMR